MDWRVCPYILNVVEPFLAHERQAQNLVDRLEEPFHRYVFDISGLDQAEYGSERIQRLGGSVLHHLHDKVVGVLNGSRISHTNERWPEITNQTWYSGNWHVPRSVTRINRILLAQQMTEGNVWQIVHTYDLAVPDYDVRQDPLYREAAAQIVPKKTPRSA